MPVISYGVILYRKRPRGKEYLMICRRNTLGYIDFLRGKYIPSQKYYILNMMKQMTQTELNDIVTKSFDELWNELWANISQDETETPPLPIPETVATVSYNNQYRVEECSSRSKFNQLQQGVYTSTGSTGSVMGTASAASTEWYSLKTMVDEVHSLRPAYDVPEWGFPKGRRNHNESEYDCALREFLEETGMTMKHIEPIYNLYPVEEMFIGSNYKSYKHKYFIMFLNDGGLDSTEEDKLPKPYCSEVSQQSWKTLDECVACIRPYNVEKKKLIQNVDRAITKYTK